MERRDLGATFGALALALTLGAAAPAAADDDRKMDRQIELFERVLDDALVESPNWLVQSQREARGRYRAGQGATFRVDASLVGSNWGGSKWFGNWWDDDDRIIIIGDDDWDEDDDADRKSSREKRVEKKKKWLDRQLKRDERLYSRGKVEILETIADYGDVLSGVPAGESLVIEMDLERAELFEEKDLSTLTFSVKMSDVRAYADGQLDEKAFITRIQVSES
jgi:hypothetical protein